jgi:transketolase
MSTLDQLSVNALRFLAVDAVQKANSGHPGAPLGCAPITYLLYNKLMKHDPSDAKWTDRDRFILSNGHASALLYSVLHLSGYNVKMSDLESFRQWGSITPGHPEYGETDGVEVTTGPLGQGFGMAVGIAVAEKHLAATYNRQGFDIVDHYTYVLCGDGDLMEGISHETASLAGTLGLGKLIVFYDDNLISLDGPTELSYTEDVAKRFQAYGWQTLWVEDGNDLERMEKVVTEAKAETGKPTLVLMRTVIGYGSPKAGTKGAHGEPLGAEAVASTKKTLGWPEDKSFYVPDEVQKHYGEAKEKGKKAHDAWKAHFAKYATAYPEVAAEFERVISAKLPANWAEKIPVFGPEKAVATRTAGGNVMLAIQNVLPELFGGAADLTSSTKTLFKSESFHVDPKGRNVFFGVREFGMCAMVNGMAAHGGLIPFGSTFFVFSDYARPALRMAALMSVHSLFVFTHDSIGLGEDGPTHQPVEHLMALRAIPQLTDFRPADANETAACWQLAVERKSASFMALSRQDLPVLDAAKTKAGVKHGAYILEEGGAKADVILVATGSEVDLALKSAAELKSQGVTARVVSMPSWKLFDEQDASYKATVFPAGVPAVSIEAGASLGWWKYVGSAGAVIGLDRFGASAPGKIAMEKLGFSVANVVEHAKKVIAGKK